MEQADLMGIHLTRKERRKMAREKGVPFEPQYNGNPPVTFKEHYGYNFYEEKPKELKKNAKQQVQEYLDTFINGRG